jgi:hypothetical protein
MLVNAVPAVYRSPAPQPQGDMSLITTDRLSAGPAMLRSLCERCGERESGRASR